MEVTGNKEITMLEEFNVEGIISNWKNEMMGEDSDIGKDSDVEKERM